MIWRIVPAVQQGKGEKGKVVHPSLLGFSVTSNQILMREIPQEATRSVIGPFLEPVLSPIVDLVTIRVCHPVTKLSERYVRIDKVQCKRIQEPPYKQPWVLDFMVRSVLKHI